MSVMRMVGYAFTLRYVPTREDMVDELYDNTKNVQRLAVEAVEADDVLVMDARGDVGAATLGNILATRLRARGAGFGDRCRLRIHARVSQTRFPSLCQRRPRGDLV
ncbi:MAG: hypothetical protein R2932_20645 [Caldilineaceae bacterium]